MGCFKLPVDQIQPSQLYISRDKLTKVNKYLKTTAYSQPELLPVKQIGDLVFFTDGHTRALALWEQGLAELDVYLDQDDLDWLQYLICVQWCQDLGVHQIRDLSNRIVDHLEYERLWYDRCAQMQNAVKRGFYEGVGIRQVTEH